MPYDLGRLGSYVRFYLTVAKQLDGAWDNLERTHLTVKEAMTPFADPLAKVGSTALAEAMGKPPADPERRAALLRPEDEAELSGLTDVYEVVGRFTFQGEDNDNLARVQALVSGARNEIVTQRLRLADLAKLPEQARATASRMGTEEDARAQSLRAEKTAAFEPLAEQVGLRAKQTLDAVKAVPFPDLSNADSAADEYKRFAQKLDSVYQTCLPFLRKSITSLYGFVGCEPTASWPDTLPLTRDLPAELVTVPPADSPELSAARQGLKDLGEEEIRLGRERDDIASGIARAEGEQAAAAVRDKEADLEIATATQIVDYVAATEAAQGARMTLVALDAAKAERLRAAGEVYQRHQSIEAGIRLLGEELERRTAEINAAYEHLAIEKKNEPVLFGKDEWRLRVAEIEANAQALKAQFAERQGVLSGLKIDLSSVSVQVQTEQQSAALVDRQIAEVRATLEATQKNLRDLATALGANRPARPVAVADAREALGTLQQAKLENAQRLDRLREEIRRRKEETVRVLTRLKQIGVERAQVQAMVQSAQVAATEGHEGALRHLAVQRRAAVERHVAEVLGTLEKSLTMVGPVFVDPARKVMHDQSAPDPAAAAALVENADKLGPVVEKLSRELDAALLAQDAGLGQIQREFCDVAPGACRAAWS